jgi:hypothetical protein
MTPDQAIQLTSAMKEMGVEAFELESLKVRFGQTQSPLAELGKTSPLTKEDLAKVQSEINERLIFGSSM